MASLLSRADTFGANTRLIIRPVWINYPQLTEITCPLNLKCIKLAEPIITITIFHYRWNSLVFIYPNSSNQTILTNQRPHKKKVNVFNRKEIKKNKEIWYEINWSIERKWKKIHVKMNQLFSERKMRENKWFIFPFSISFLSLKSVQPNKPLTVYKILYFCVLQTNVFIFFTFKWYICLIYS